MLLGIDFTSSSPIVVWESLKHHQDLIANKELYPKLTESLLKGAAGLTYLYHVNLNTEDPSPALGAPLTEIVFWSLKEGVDKEEFTTKLNSLITLAMSFEGVYKGGWGTVVEDDRKLAVILGWNSLEVCSRRVLPAYVDR